MPALHGRSAEIEDRDSRHKLAHNLSAETTVALKTLVSQHRLTINLLVQAAWALALARYNDVDDVCFGATTSGRSAPVEGIEDMIGMFLNTLPLRLRVFESRSLLGWLNELAAEQVEREHFGYTPLAEIQSLSEVPPGEDLFASILVFENLRGDKAMEQKKGPVSIQTLGSAGHTNFPFALVAIPEPVLRLEIQYEIARFDAADIERLLIHLETILEAMPANIEGTIAGLPMLSQWERTQTLYAWNKTAADFDGPDTIHGLFEAQVARTPDAPALQPPAGTPISYRDLNERADRLAVQLANRYSETENCVALYIDRSPEMVVAMLAIFKSGCLYLPLDPTWPSGRRSLILEDAAVALILTSTALISELADIATPVLAVDGNSVGEPPHRLRAVLAQQAAYIFYTSGSTGTPKAVCNSHAAMVNRLQWAQKCYPLDTSDRFLQLAAYSFDISLWEVFGPLMAGALLVQLPPQSKGDPTAILTCVAKQGITALHMVPSLLQSLMNLGRPVPGLPPETPLHRR